MGRGSEKRGREGEREGGRDGERVTMIANMVKSKSSSSTVFSNTDCDTPLCFSFTTSSFIRSSYGH